MLEYVFQAGVQVDSPREDHEASGGGSTPMTGTEEDGSDKELITIQEPYTME